MLSILKVLLQFVLTASSPNETCELVHRDASVTGTYYLYCARTPTAGITVISVGRFVPDAPTIHSEQLLKGRENGKD